ncbi:MAG: hypothetical protein C4278_01280 [Patescibacteria group bacterium]
MNNKNLIILFGILIVILLSSYYIWQKKKMGQLTSQTPELTPQIPDLAPQPLPVETPTPTETPTKTEKTTPTTSESVVIITDSGFNPKELTINKGAKVTFVNQSSSASWPASDVHPTHRLYPGSGIEKCGTSQQNKIFDACRGLKPGESWSFVFKEVGEWSYHDHLNPSKTGKIIVR